MAAGDASAHGRDRIEAVRVGIAQHQLVDDELVAQAGDPIDELGRVGASASDDSDLHRRAADPPLTFRGAATKLLG